MKKCGSIALVGPPNAGKSTLLNAILNTKLSIVSHKRQTTRFALAGIHIQGDTQMIFWDTPGIFQPKTLLERRMVAEAWRSLEKVHGIVMLIDAQRSFEEKDIQNILQRLQKHEKKIILVLNKIDLVPKETLLNKAQQYMTTGIVEDIFMISALKKKGLERFLAALDRKMPEGEWEYPEDQLSNQSQKILMAEITREKILFYVHEEIPYGLVVLPEVFESLSEKGVKIVQTIVIQDPGHKPILLGKGGQKIKTIGQAARHAMEEFLGCKVHLILHVRIDERWQEKNYYYHETGFEGGV